MNIFKLPDLGEGLPDAEIHEWFVKEGDVIKQDAPLVSMETAKAVVEVPSPQDGVIKKLYGRSGDIIKTGEPLVEFQNDNNKSDTVVGKLETIATHRPDDFTIGSKETKRIKTTPAVRMLAKKLGVDLETITPTGEHGFITKEDVEQGMQNNVPKDINYEIDYEPLRGVRRAMLSSMVESHREVVPVTIFDEIILNNFDNNTDITVCIITALIKAIKQEPALNAWFNKEKSARKIFTEVNLGLAMDTEDGLFVPVINNAGELSQKELRESINQYKITINNRTTPPENFKNATFTLSNFGKFAGRFASPIIVPPMVAILAVGKLYEAVVPINQEVTIKNILPLSLSFDHRAVTGGEATRFLGAIIKEIKVN